MDEDGDDADEDEGEEDDDYDDEDDDDNEEEAEEEEEDKVGEGWVGGDWFHRERGKIIHSRHQSMPRMHASLCTRACVLPNATPYSNAQDSMPCRTATHNAASLRAHCAGQHPADSPLPQA